MERQARVASFAPSNIADLVIAMAGLLLVVFVFFPARLVANGLKRLFAAVR